MAPRGGQYHLICMSEDLGGLVPSGETADVQAFAEQLLEESPEAASGSEQPQEGTLSTEGEGDPSQSTRQATEESEEPDAVATADGEDAIEEEPTKDASEEESTATDEEQDVFEVPQPDGTVREMTLEEIGQGTLLMADYTRKSQEVAEQRRAVESDREQLQNSVQERLGRIDGLARELGARLQGLQMSPEQWDQLREEDFAEFDRRREQEQGIVNALQNAGQERDRALHEQRASQVPKEKEKLVAALAADGYTDFGNPEVFNTEYQRLGEFVVREFGVTPEQWNTTIDSVSIRIAYHAMKNKEAAAQAVSLKNKIRRKPKPSMRAGAARSPGNPVEEKRKAAAARLKKSGRWQDAGDVLLQDQP